MKLNYKNTILVGFAFFLICAFWQAYDNTIPMILTNKFGMSQTVSGAIMALDNVLALFMLPLFGAISDRTKSKRGRRTPYILVGTIVAALTFVALSLLDAAQLKNIQQYSAIDDPATLRAIYDDAAKNDELMTPDGRKFSLTEEFTVEEFSEIKSTITNSEGKTITNPDYTNYVVPARQWVIQSITHGSPGNLIAFFVLLMITLLAMAVFRSPAVALMPDVTIKPLRSKANAVINLMGSAGGIIVLALGIVFATSSVKNSMMSYIGYFAVIAGLMLLSVLIFSLTVNEPALVEKMKAESEKFGIQEDEPQEVVTGERRKLSSEERKSLIFLLLSIVLWYMGYNAVTSKYSVYASTILHKDYNLTLIIAQVAAIISYLPVGVIASKVGRKKTILAGVVMLTPLVQLHL